MGLAASGPFRNNGYRLCRLLGLKPSPGADLLCSRRAKHLLLALWARGCWDGRRLWLCSNLCAFLPQGMISSWLQSTSWGTRWVWNTPMIPVLSWLLSTSTWKHTTSNCPRMTSKEFRKSMVSKPMYFFTYTKF